jgi:DNA-binding beta-propeller fold protein YncE
LNLSLRHTGILLFAIAGLLAGSCKTDPHIWEKGGGQFPPAVGKILLNKCATPGCHNSESFEAASGLNLASWEDMFKGARSGASVIPFNHRFSPLFLFTNTHDDLGIGNLPTMPVNQPALTREEVVLLRDWINAGAPRDDGHVKFSDNPKRRKYYVVNQGCDVVTVFDAETNLPMRYIEVGNNPNMIESPHQIRVSPDGKHYYVIFLTGPYFQKYRCSDDAYVGEVRIGNGNWNTFLISSDSKYAWAVDYFSQENPIFGQGAVAYIDLTTLQVRRYYAGFGLFQFPHGVMLSPDDKTLYLFNQEGSQFYKVNMDPAQGNSAMAPEVSLPMNMDGFNGQILKPHDVIFSADYQQYYVTCQSTNDVRVFNTSDDKLVKIIPVGDYPQELALSKSKGLLFVTCMEDQTTYPGNRGSVYAIDVNTFQVVKTFYTGHQPHGIAVDDKLGKVIVANRNATNDGPAPHHTTDCEGRNGSVVVIDLNTLELNRRLRNEVSVDPYFVAIRE